MSNTKQNSVDVKTYIERSFNEYDITDFSYNEEDNYFYATADTDTVTIIIDITPLEDKIILHAVAGFEIPEDKFWQVLDYINNINATDENFPRLYINSPIDDFYNLDAKYIMPIHSQMSINAFIGMLSALISILQDYAPDILRIILDIETEENQ